MFIPGVVAASPTILNLMRVYGVQYLRKQRAPLLQKISENSSHSTYTQTVQIRPKSTWAFGRGRVLNLESVSTHCSTPGQTKE